MQVQNLEKLVIMMTTIIEKSIENKVNSKLEDISKDYLIYGSI